MNGAEILISHVFSRIKYKNGQRLAIEKDREQVTYREIERERKDAQ